jgi:hypothetical protein
MKIETRGGISFLKVDIFYKEYVKEEIELNPFMINIDQIRYIREYNDDIANAWGIFVGNKMFATRDIDFDFEIGKTIRIGNTDFECAITSCLNGKEHYRTLINYKNVIHTRKYFSKDTENQENLDKFAIITVDERIIAVNEYEPIRSTNNSASVQA